MTRVVKKSSSLPSTGFIRPGAPAVSGSSPSSIDQNPEGLWLRTNSSNGVGLLKRKRICRRCVRLTLCIADQSSNNYPASNNGTIVCVQCHIEKSVLDFHANRRLRTGRSTLCKTCTKGRWLSLYRSSP